jgi:hypothetical protein
MERTAERRVEQQLTRLTALERLRDSSPPLAQLIEAGETIR